MSRHYELALDDIDDPAILSDDKGPASIPTSSRPDRRTRPPLWSSSIHLRSEADLARREVQSLVRDLPVEDPCYQPWLDPYRLRISPAGASGRQLACERATSIKTC